MINIKPNRVLSKSAMSCQVRFRIQSDAPDEFVAAWKTMVKALTDSSETVKVRVELHEAISQRVQATATLHNNDAKILKRCEGGFGGDMNICDRQIRFRSRIGSRIGCWYDPLEIHMDPSSGSVKLAGDHKMEWTMSDLIDFKHATVMALNNYLYKKVTGADGSIDNLCIDAHTVFGHEKETFERYVV